MKKILFLFLMESCSLGLYARRPLPLFTATKSSTAFLGAALKNDTNTICFFYDEAGNCIKRSNKLNSSKHLDFVPHSRSESILIKDNFATVSLNSNNDIKVRLTIPPQNVGQVSVYSLSGMLISTTDIKSIETTLSIKDQPTGIYIVNVTADGITKNFKISKL